MRIRSLLLTLAASTTAVFVAATAAALPLGPGTYTLKNHRDGGAAAPFYGLRLDGLHDGDPDTIYTFDFEATGASMHLTYDDTANTILISGTAFGGEDVGSSYLNPSFYDIKFRYTNVQVEGHNLVSDSGEGKIARQGDAPIDLESYAGKHAHDFFLGKGHRGYEGYSGRGWLLYGGNSSYARSSDWLFEVPVPEPSGALVFGIGLLVSSGAARRRRLA